MIFGLLYFCVVILCVNRSRTSFILYRIVKRHSRQSNVRRIWTCADNVVLGRHCLVVRFGAQTKIDNFCYVAKIENPLTNCRKQSISKNIF